MIRVVYVLVLLSVCITAVKSEESYSRYYAARNDQVFEIHQSYLLGVAMYSLLGIILAVVSVVVAVMLCCCAHCVSGGKHTMLYRVGFLICSISIFVGCVVTLEGNVSYSRGFKNFAEISVDLITNFESEQQSIQNSLATIQPEFNSSIISDKVTNAVKEVVNAKNFVNGVENARLWSFCMVIAIVLLLAVFGFVLGIIPRKMFLTTFIFLIASTLWLLWVFYGLHLPLSIYNDDMCYSVHMYQTNHTDKSGVLNDLIKLCNDEQFLQQALAKTDEISQDILNALNGTASKYGVQLSNFVPNGTAQDQLQFIINYANQSISQVEEKIGNFSEIDRTQIEPQLNKMRAILDLTKRISSWIRCEGIDEWIDEIRQPLCSKMLPGMIHVLIGQYIIAAFFYVLLFTLASAKGS